MSRNCSAGVSALALLLAGCADDATPQQKKAADDRAIAQVEAVQKIRPPVRPIAPQPILFGDMERFKLFGAGCAFAPGTSMGAVLLTRPKTAFVKLADKLVRFASDPGSARLPLETVSRYVGKEYAASLTRDAGEAQDALRFAGRLVITDPYDQVVYAADGLIQCSA